MGSRLSTLGIQNSCVLDIRYPDHHVVAFLVRNEYAPTFISVFAEYNINPLKDFDPLGVKILRDLQHTDEFAYNPKEKQLDIIKRIHNCSKTTQKINYS
ncbi:hypothetical protein BDF21DRAFT_220042 [Thamnidium elegans]|nr:hypothetical protein BDF21DRAFT_220042 [Thamnidium elegans]